MLLHVGEPTPGMIAGMHDVLTTRFEGAQPSSEDAIAIFKAVLDLAASAYLAECPTDPVDRRGTDERSASLLPETGAAATHHDALAWATRTAAHVRASFDGKPASLRMWSFRDRIEGLQLRFDTPGFPSVTVTLCAGGQYSFSDGHAFVPDLAEAIHLADILACESGTGIVRLGRETEGAHIRENSREKAIDADENAGSSACGERRLKEGHAAAISALDAREISIWVEAVRRLIADRMGSAALFMVLHGVRDAGALEATISDGLDRMVLSFPIGPDPSGRNLNHALDALAALASASRANVLLEGSSNALDPSHPDRRH